MSISGNHLTEEKNAETWQPWTLCDRGQTTQPGPGYRDLQWWHSGRGEQRRAPPASSIPWPRSRWKLSIGPWLDPQSCYWSFIEAWWAEYLHGPEKVVGWVTMWYGINRTNWNTHLGFIWLRKFPSQISEDSVSNWIFRSPETVFKLKVLGFN